MKTMQEFEQLFAQRKADYIAKYNDLHHQLAVLKREYHAGNTELNHIRCQTIKSDPKKVRKHECYALQHYLGGVLNEWTKTKQLDAVNGVVHFNCCAEDAAVITITIPYKQAEPAEGVNEEV